MAKCEECGREYWQEKSWQRFCNPKCRDDWHNHQKKLAQIAVAEELRELRLANGNGARPSEAQHEAASQFVAKMVRRT
jgi:uncharacterized Zn ribbon protein